MLLHKNQSLFNQITNSASEEYGIDVLIIRKDYFVSLFLKEFIKYEPDMIFKGGTSLSKCYQLIDRFSEDIDITFQKDGQAISAGDRRRSNHNVIETCKQLGFTILNLEKIKSRAKFNMFNVFTGYINDNTSVRDSIIVEIATQTVPFPIVKKKLTSYVNDYLHDNELDELIKEFDLFNFEVNVQDITRTFVDKVFAICDYHMEGKYLEKSRHIYDLYKLWPAVKDDVTQNLIDGVRLNRKDYSKCYSAKDDVNIVTMIKEIFEQKSYKDDYENSTSPLLFEPVSYEEASNVLLDIVNSELFERN